MANEQQNDRRHPPRSPAEAAERGREAADQGLAVGWQPASRVAADPAETSPVVAGDANSRTESAVSYNPGPESIDAVRDEVREQLAAERAAAEAKDKAEGGLERRYHVERLNDTEGKHTDCRFFVLDPQHDPIAREALRRYATVAAEKGYRTLAIDLRDWVESIPVGAGGAT